MKITKNETIDIKNQLSANAINNTRKMMTNYLKRQFSTL